MTTVGGDRALVDCERAVSTADDSTRTGELADRIRASKAGISSTGRSTGGELQGRGVQTSEEQIVSATYTLVRDRATEATAPATEIPDVGIDLAITRATKVQSATTRQRTADVIITAGCINDGSTGSSCCDDVIRVNGVVSHILRQYATRKCDRSRSRSCCISQNQGSRTKGRAAGIRVCTAERGRSRAVLHKTTVTADDVSQRLGARAAGLNHTTGCGDQAIAEHMRARACEIEGRSRSDIDCRGPVPLHQTRDVEGGAVHGQVGIVGGKCAVVAIAGGWIYGGDVVDRDIGCATTDGESAVRSTQSPETEKPAIVDGNTATSVSYVEGSCAGITTSVINN